MSSKSSQSDTKNQIAYADESIREVSGDRAFILDTKQGGAVIGNQIEVNSTGFSGNDVRRVLSDIGLYTRDVLADAQAVTRDVLDQNAAATESIAAIAESAAGSQSELGRIVNKFMLPALVLVALLLLLKGK